MSVCILCHGVHRQTDRHSREISEIVPAHTGARAFVRSLAHPWAAVVISVKLIRSRSVYTYIHRHTSSMFVCLLFWVYLTAGCLTLIRYRSSYNCVTVYASICYLLFVFFSITYSWLPDSLFFLGTGGFLWCTTSCRSFRRIFLPDFHRFSECACFTWLSTEILCLSASVDFLSLLDMYLRISEIVLAHARAHTHIQRSLAHPWAAVVTSVTLFALAPYAHIHTQTHKYACLFACFYTDTQVCMFVCLLDSCLT